MHTLGRPPRGMRYEGFDCNSELLYQYRSRGNRHPTPLRPSTISLLVRFTRGSFSKCDFVNCIRNHEWCRIEMVNANSTTQNWPQAHKYVGYILDILTEGTRIGKLTRAGTPLRTVYIRDWCILHGCIWIARTLLFIRMKHGGKKQLLPVIAKIFFKKWSNILFSVLDRPCYLWVEVKSSSSTSISSASSRSSSSSSSSAVVTGTSGPVGRFEVLNWVSSCRWV